MQEFEVFTIPTTVDQSSSYAIIQAGYIASDWAILNGTTPQQLSRMLTQLSAAEITQSCALLEGYQAVYRPELLKYRK